MSKKKKRYSKWLLLIRMYYLFPQPTWDCNPLSFVFWLPLWTTIMSGSKCVNCAAFQIINSNRLAVWGALWRFLCQLWEEDCLAANGIVICQERNWIIFEGFQGSQTKVLHKICCVRIRCSLFASVKNNPLNSTLV